MHQYSRFSATRPGSNHYVLAVFIFYYFSLPRRKLVNDFMILLWSDVVVDFVFAISLEIFLQEHLVFQGKIIAHKSQRLLAIANHHVGVFANDVDLLHFHLVEIIQLFVVVDFIFYQIVLFDSVYFKSIIQDQKAVFYL